MKRIFLALLILPFCSGCSWFKQASVQAALKSAAAQGCQAQSDILGGFSKSLAGKLNCSAPDKIQASLTAALGNVNICKYAPASSAVKIQGVVGNIVCPVAVSAAIGFMTAQIPQEWGCTVSDQASAVSAALVSICEASVPL